MGTDDTQTGTGQIYVFGQRRVSVTFRLPRNASVKHLHFCADKLVSVDSKNELCVFSLETRKMLASYAPPSFVSAVMTDPSLDYVFLGLQNGEFRTSLACRLSFLTWGSGETIAYDMDREVLTPFKLPNLWAEKFPQKKMTPVVSLALAPRDVGKLLIGYPEGAVIYSFKQNVAQKYFQYEVPVGAPGGDSDPTLSREVRRPRLTKAIWHPSDTFILTVHEDTSLAFWDPKDGRLVMARTIDRVNVNQPGQRPESPGSAPGTFAVRDPIFQVAWCAKENPDDTGLLIAGGRPSNDPDKSLTFLDLGPTPNYQTSSWQILAKYFESPRRRMNLTVPPGAEAVDFCLVPRSSPHFAGAQDPIAVVALLSSGELITLSFPSGHPISPTNMLHPSLSFVHPFVTKMVMAPVSRSNWLGLKERRAQGPKFVQGGVQAKKPMKRFEDRNVIVTAHADGVIRLWDAGQNDEIENVDVVQADLARAVARTGAIEVTEMSFSGASGELSVGLRTGELVIFRWGRNQFAGQEQPPGRNEGPGKLTNILHRADPYLKDGLLPATMLEMQNGPVSAVKNSDVGFVAVGFEEGSLAIIDLRGPQIIYNADVHEFIKAASKRSSFRMSRSQDDGARVSEWPTSIEFGVLTLEGDGMYPTGEKMPWCTC